MSESHLDLTKFGQTLKEFRKSSGFTQEQVAQRLKIGPVTVSDYERGRVNLPLEKAVQLARLYGVSLDKLVGFETSSDKANEGIEKESIGLNRLVPLINLGLFGEEYDQVQHLIVSDPVIMVHLGINEVRKRHGLFHNIVEKLTETQKRDFTVELLKYLYSLMAADGQIRTEELAFLEFVESELTFKPSEPEIEAIKRASQKRYFGGGVRKFFPVDGIRHLAIWTMNILAHVDKELHPEEANYITKVAEHFGISSSTSKYIAHKVSESFRNMKRLEKPR